MSYCIMHPCLWVFSPGQENVVAQSAHVCPSTNRGTNNDSLCGLL
jgi:hypothetical protein